MQTARKPNSVLDDHSSRRRITAALEQPTRGLRLPLSFRSRAPSALAHRAGTPRPPGEWRSGPCLFGLAPCGVYIAASVTSRAVRSYRTFSPLPLARLRSLRRYVFCCTGRPDGLNHPSRTLSGTLPCGVRTFLSRSTACAASGSDHPAACRFQFNSALNSREK